MRPHAHRLARGRCPRSDRHARPLA
jgi:hypothetical protein